MPPQTFVFHVHACLNCDNLKGQIERTIGADLININPNTGHVTLLTTKNPEDVRLALKREIKRRVDLLSPLNNSLDSSVLDNQDTVVDTTVADVGARENIHDGINIDINPEDVELALEYKTEESVVLLPSLNNSESTTILNNQNTAIVPHLRTTVTDVGGRENVLEEININIIHAFGLYVFLLLLLVCILVRYCCWYAIAAMLLVCYCYWSAAALLLVPVCRCCWFVTVMLLLLLGLLLPAGPWNPKKVRTPTSPMQLTNQPFSSENSNRKITTIDPQQRTEIIITDAQVVNARPGSSRETDSYTNRNPARLDGTLTISNASSRAPPLNIVVENNGCKIIITINLRQAINARPGEDEIANGRQKTNHQHDLVLKRTRSSYKCSGCKELGFGDRYVCERCPYFLHPDCMYYKEIATHDFLEGSNFKFCQKPPRTKNLYCDACGMYIYGFCYRCERTNKVLHPCCLNLGKTVTIGKENFQLCRDLRSKCCYCNSKNKKDYRDKCWCYSLENNDYHFHVYCMKDVLLNCWNGGGGGGGGDGNGAMVLANRKKKVFKAIKWAGKLLEIVLSVLTGNPISLFTVGLELLGQ